MQIKMPIVASSNTNNIDGSSTSAIIKGYFDRLLNRIDAFQFSPKIFNRINEPDYYMAPFSVERKQLYDIYN